VLINEVIAENSLVPPTDISGGNPDVIELLNASDDTVSLGVSDIAKSWYLSDTLEFDLASAWKFPSSGGKSVVPPGGRLVIFCDGNAVEALCELHATFSIASDGTEPLTLWGPVDGEGQRPIVDQVWLPPLRNNVSFGRSPDGAGPAPMPVEDTFDHFTYFPLGSDSPPTFGICEAHPQQTELCSRIAPADRLCAGGANGAGASAQVPLIERARHSTNRPLAGEAVQITARVRDDREPTPDNIVKAEIRYRVNGGEVQIAPLSFDAATGIVDGSDRIPPQPLDRWTLWTGTVPGQAAASRVEFYFYVEDATALHSTGPRDLCGDPEGPCPECTGPCDQEFGGAGCKRDLTDVTCVTDEGDVRGERYIACEAWLAYFVGYEVRAELEGLVINEIVPSQDGLLLDETQREDCRTSASCPAGDLTCCPPDDPRCCDKREDFVELYNASDRTIDLAGLWLTDSYFNPREWQFPAGSKILAGEYLIVWLDNDGGKCPNPLRPDPPCFWECPDPTKPSSQEYHTNFALDANGDQLFLCDTAEHGFGIIQGVIFGDNTPLVVTLNRAISLLPNGDGTGCYRVGDPSPRAANVGDPCSTTEPTFLRGDASNDCGVDLSDAVFILNWLFQAGADPSCPDAADVDDSGSHDITDAINVLNWLFLGGRVPAPPGPRVRGIDPSADDLGACIYDSGCP
jgi:hypothetical protein